MNIAHYASLSSLVLLLVATVQATAPVVVGSVEQTPPTNSPCERISSDQPDSATKTQKKTTTLSLLAARRRGNLFFLHKITCYHQVNKKREIATPGAAQALGLVD